MRRSLLFVPGDNPGMLQSAGVYNADSIIIDLEDSISLPNKDSARILVNEFLKDHKLKKEVIVRINSFDSPYYKEDLELLVSDNIDTILLPKANLENTVKLDAMLSKLEHEKKLKKTIKIIPLIEQVASLLEVEEIALLNRVDGILLGAEDLTTDMGVERTKKGLEIFYPRAKVAMACINAGIEAIDTPFTDTRDFIGLEEDCHMSKGLGFKAKSAIHPNHIDIINNVYSPSKEEIVYAIQVLEMAKTNKGAFSINNKMIDKPVIERAKKTIENAKAFGLI
ncbi:MAG TPA: CoA ester lyase [Acholeplasmataceae bacterium]|jgi:citrate lyase subunit beta/citryl-CoA lyase|nr:CoA ester lyase [Acholeplasmataceae bacterium]